MGGYPPQGCVAPPGYPPPPPVQLEVQPQVQIPSLPPPPVLTGDETPEELVRKVKDLQKSDPVGREQWGHFADQCGGGKRDPFKHSPEGLIAFLTGYANGEKIKPEEEVLEIQYITKLMQRKSQAFKEVWSNYCLQHGGGRSDPLRHDAAFHVQFFDSLAGSATASSQGSSVQSVSFQTSGCLG